LENPDTTKAETVAEHREQLPPQLHDTGERMIPTQQGEVSVVFARHTLTYEYALGFVEGRTVLDAGCGTGYGSALLASRARRVCAIDLSNEAIEYCRRQYAAPNLEFLQMDVTQLPFRHTFDVAVSFQVIEHLPDPDAFLRTLKHAVHPGGSIVLATPNVRVPRAGDASNPFHCSEMSYAGLHALLSRHFASFQISGIAHARQNALRAFVYRSPLYALGKRLRRGSVVKKLANKTLDMTSFRIITERVAEEALDLIAVCTNDGSRAV
jgi:2-polyprenyl-3-methyl-5-hydroxy-6-metoxy-1,4-benzoquinol methylase